MEKTSSYKVGAYIRLSREDGDDRESESVENQRSIIEKYVEEHQDLILIDVYADDGYTGTNFNRPEFKRMYQDIEKGKINAIITKDLSRFGRDHIETGYYLEKDFPSKNIRYIAIGDTVDTLNQESMNFLAFKLGFADYYAQDISNKIRSVKKNKAQRGEYQAGTPPYGYKKSKRYKNKLEIDEQTAPIVKRIYDLYLKGYGTRKIAEIFDDEGTPSPGEYYTREQYKSKIGRWKRNTILKILKSEVYIGSVVSGITKKASHKSKKFVRQEKEKWIIVPNMHEPIIDEETFQKVQDRINDKTAIRTRKHDHELKGLIYCGKCGSRMTIKPDCRGKNININFICSRKNANRNYCDNSSVSGKLLYDIVIDSLITECKNILFSEKELEDIIKQIEYEMNKDRDKLNGQLKVLSEQVVKIDNSIKELYQDKLSKLISAQDFSNIYSGIQADREKVNLEKVELENMLKQQQDKKVIDIEELKKTCKEVLKMENLNKELLNRLIERIEVSSGYEIKIRYNFGMNE